MSQDKHNKVLIRRPSRVTTDSRGRSVWADPVDSAELELVSTQMLKQILTSKDTKDRDAVRDAAKTNTEGVLALDPATGLFEIIEDEALQVILEQERNLPKISRPADVTVEPLHDYADSDHLSLVSTQALRRVLDNDDEEEALLEVDCGGFNPYDHS